MSTPPLTNPLASEPRPESRPLRGFLLGAMLGLVGLVVARFTTDRAAQRWAALGFLLHSALLPYAFMTLISLQGGLMPNAALAPRRPPLPQPTHVRSDLCSCGFTLPPTMKVMPVEGARDFFVAFDLDRKIALTARAVRRDTVGVGTLEEAAPLLAIDKSDRPFTPAPLGFSNRVRRAYTTEAAGPNGQSASMYTIEIVAASASYFHLVTISTPAERRDELAPEMQAILDTAGFYFDINDIVRHTTKR